MIDPLADQLYKSGTLDDLIKKGWVSINMKRDIEYCYKVEAQQLTGMCRTQAIDYVSAIADVSDRTVRRALERYKGGGRVRGI